MINNVDLSNSTLTGFSGTTRPQDFESGNISQVIGATTQSTLMLKVVNNQVAGTLNINKYMMDVSGNNGTNATKQTKTKVPVLQLPTSTNSDVSLNDLSANTFYDLSVNMFNVEDMSSNKIVASGTTRPSEFATNGKDVSQNVTSTDMSMNKIVMNIKHKDVAGTLDISGYTIKYSARGNSDSNTITKTATVKSAHLSNYDVSINNLVYPNSIYDMSINLFNVNDMSNAYIDISGLTKPRDFITTDVSQNKPDTTDTSLILKINSKQDVNSLNIKSYVIDYSGNNGSNATSSTRTLNPTNASANAVNSITITDLSANTVYDLSAHLINSEDMSNNKLVARGVTRPKDFESGNISQVIGTTTQSTLMMSVNSNQVAGTLNINKYRFDVSGNNATNATSQVVNKVPTSQLANAINTDVSLNDLSANTLYDLSVNMFNVEDMSSNKIVASGVTRPSNFADAKDVSQNTTSSKITTSTVSLGIQHKDVAGTLDINGYNISYSVNGANTDDGSKIITAKNKLPTDSSDNVVITGLSYPNSTYSFDVYLFNEHDMSNSTITVTGDTRPSNFVSTDVSQNKADTTATSLILNVNSSQDANSLVD